VTDGLIVSTLSLPNGSTYKTYSAKIVTTGGKTPYAYSTTSLPPGLKLSSAGVISGTPTVAGTYRFTVTVRDATGEASAPSYGITISPLTITSPTFFETPIQKAFSAKLTAVGGKGTLTWKAATPLPTGVTLSTAGALTATMPTVGDFGFSVTVTDAATPKQSVTEFVTIRVDPLAVVFAKPVPPGYVGVPYSYALKANGGKGTLKWTLISGSLPRGLKLSTSGSISGTPQDNPGAGNFFYYSFQVKVTDSAVPANSATANVSITIGVL